MLTQSDNDHEALAAIRKANQLLAVYNLNWEGYLGVAKQMDIDEQESREPPHPASECPSSYDDYSLQGMNNRERTIKMFRVVKARLEEEGSDAISFIHSLEDGFAKYGSLTANQYYALKKFYDRVKRTSAF